MIRKVYEVDPMLCPKCGGTMEVVAFLTDFLITLSHAGGGRFG
ncbi:MAG: hypothetical protein WCB96_12410 [Candidatus Aminicenantales bacterium]